MNGVNEDENFKFKHKLYEVGGIMRTAQKNEYEVESVLYNWEFGDLYQVKSVKTKELKLMRTELLNTPKSYRQINYIAVLHEALIKCKDKIAKKHFSINEDIGRDKISKFLILPLVGPTISDLRKYAMDSNYSPSEALFLSVQTYFAIENLHSMGFVHGDITPHCFSFGIGDIERQSSRKDMESGKQSQVYLTDYGRIRKHANSKNVVRSPRPRVPYFGKGVYAPRTAHRRLDFSTKDDLESWIYVSSDLFDDMNPPWKRIRKNHEEDILKMKEELFALNEEVIKNLFQFYPKEFQVLLKPLDAVTFENFPNYAQFRKCFQQAKTTVGMCKKAPWMGISKKNVNIPKKKRPGCLEMEKNDMDILEEDDDDPEKLFLSESERRRKKKEDKEMKKGSIIIGSKERDSTRKKVLFQWRSGKRPTREKMQTESPKIVVTSKQDIETQTKPISLPTELPKVSEKPSDKDIGEKKENDDILDFMEKLRNGSKDLVLLTEMGKRDEDTKGKTKGSREKEKDGRGSGSREKDKVTPQKTSDRKQRDTRPTPTVLGTPETLGDTQIEKEKDRQSDKETTLNGTEIAKDVKEMKTPKSIYFVRMNCASTYTGSKKRGEDSLQTTVKVSGSQKEKGEGVKKKNKDAEIVSGKAEEKKEKQGTDSVSRKMTKKEDFGKQQSHPRDKSRKYRSQGRKKRVAKENKQRIQAETNAVYEMEKKEKSEKKVKREAAKG